MYIATLQTAEDMFDKAASDIAMLVKEQADLGDVKITFATGNTQVELLKRLVEDKEIPWNRVIGYHLDEYLGLPDHDSRLFRRFMVDHLVSKVQMKEFHFISKTDPDEPRDIAILGLGQNAHIAFNEPAPTLDERTGVIEVQLSAETIKNIPGSNKPKRAITLSIPSILSHTYIFCLANGSHKAKAVRSTIEHEDNPMVPSSYLNSHQYSILYCDSEAMNGL